MKRQNVNYPLVKENEDGTLMLNYTNMIAVLTSAVQELAKMVMR